MPSRPITISGERSTHSPTTVSGPTPSAAQVMRQPVGVRVQRRVAQLAVLEHHRNRIRRARRLRRKQLRQAAPPAPHAPWRSSPPAIARRSGRRQDRKAADRTRPASATAPSSSRTSRSPRRRNAAAVEQVGPVVEPQLQPLARLHDQGQRIMRRVVPADLASRTPARLDASAAAVDRIVLEHQQRVEQLAQSGQACWISARPRCWCAISRDWLLLRLPQQIAAAAAPAAACSRSGSVLMNSPTMLSMPATSAGRPATVTPNTTSSRPLRRPSRIAPRRLQQRVQRHPLPARLPRSAPRSASRRATARSARGATAAARPRAARRQHACASSSPASASRQAATAPLAVLPRKERQIVAVRRHPRQRRRIAAAAHRAASSSRTSTGADQPSISR